MTRFALDQRRQISGKFASVLAFNSIVVCHKVGKSTNRSLDSQVSLMNCFTRLSRVRLRGNLL